MNGSVSKKIRKSVNQATKRNFKQYVDAIRQWPFSNRFRLCWFILFSRKKVS